MWIWIHTQTNWSQSPDLRALLWGSGNRQRETWHPPPAELSSLQEGHGYQDESARCLQELAV